MARQRNRTAAPTAAPQVEETVTKEDISMTDTTTSEALDEAGVTETPVIEAPTEQQSAPVQETSASEEAATQVTQEPEVLVEAVQSPEPVAEEVAIVQAPVFDTTDTGLKEETIALLERLAAASPAAQMVPFQQLIGYMQAMKPGTVIVASAGALEQARLLRVLQNILQNSGDQFRLAFATLLKMIDDSAEAGGAFYNEMPFRFMDSVPLSRQDQIAFPALINLLITAAKVEGRQERVRKEVNLARATANALNEETRQRVMDFFEAQ